MNNGIDRDIAIKINDFLSDCLTLIQTINDNEFVPHITQQPVSVVADIGDTVTFTVVANNVIGYQWQYSRDSGETWTSWAQDIYKTSVLSLEVTEGRLALTYRCELTGKDHSKIYTNAVGITAATT